MAISPEKYKQIMKARKPTPRPAEGGGYAPEQHQRLNYSPLMQVDVYQSYLLEQILDELKKLTKNK